MKKTKKSKIKKFRQRKATTKGRKGLTEDQVIKIKKAIASGKMTQAFIAKKAGVSQPLVSAIKQGRVWASVEV